MYNLQHFLNLGTELIALLVALFCYNRIRHTIYRWMLPFLGVIFAGELISSILYHRPTIAVQYVISIGESLFYTHIFSSLSHNPILKRSIRAAGAIMTCLFVYGLVFHTLDASYYITRLTASFFLFALESLLYLYERFVRDDTVIHNRPGFWLALGVTVFFSSCSLVFLLHDFIAREELNLFGDRLYRTLPQALSVFLYSCFCVCILMNKKNEQVKNGPEEGYVTKIS